MTEAKFKLTEETINVNGKTLYRIKSLKDFGNVKKGDKGGFIEKECNLSQSGDCWVYDNAKVYNNAKVFDNADIYMAMQVSLAMQEYLVMQKSVARQKLQTI